VDQIAKGLIMTWTSVPRSYWNRLLWDDADVCAPERVREMVYAAYEPLGGWPCTFDDLITETCIWLVLKWVDPQAVIMGKRTAFGVKWICMTATPAGTRAMLAKLVELCNAEGNYAEMSDKLGAFLASRVPRVTQPEIIRQVVQKPLALSEDGRYTRTIGHLVKTKMLLGRPIVLVIRASRFCWGYDARTTEPAIGEVVL